MKLLTLLFAATLAFAAENESAPKLTDMPDALKAKLAIAQRDYQAIKAQYDAKLNAEPATAALNKVAEEAVQFCQALGKLVDYQKDGCVAPPPPAAPAAKETAK